MTDQEKLEIIKQIEEKGQELKSPSASKEMQLKLSKFEEYKIAYQNMKLQDPSFKIKKLEEVPKEKAKQFNLEEWVLNHYNKAKTTNNNQGDIKI